ncbi:unnamed protein product, partial [Musa acuminata var. zebrina]
EREREREAVFGDRSKLRVRRRREMDSNPWQISCCEHYHFKESGSGHSLDGVLEAVAAPHTHRP